LQSFQRFDSLGLKGEAAMSDLMLLSEAQMRRIEPYFPLSHGVPRVDDRLILSGIILFCATGCDGATRQGTMVRTRRSTIASSAGAGSGYSIEF
jgi:transposase